MKILVTGGAGFVGSHVVDALLKSGHEVRVYDSLVPQVHGPGAAAPSYLDPHAEFIKGDVRDREALSGALKDIDVVFHQAAVVGVGQSMYEIHRYVDNNALGTANLLDVIVNERRQVRKLIVASSMSIYGEGAYRCETCGVVGPGLRSQDQLQRRIWEQRCPVCLRTVTPVATREDKPLLATSVYSVSKRDQEDICLTVGRAYGLPCVALRYFNIYGPRQSISNPYTGVLAIFLSRLKNKAAPLVFEDGHQSRDFIHVSDIVQANLLALKKEADGEMFNVGTGRATDIFDILQVLSEALGIQVPPELTQKYRQGDIRHCFADIEKIRQRLGFMPTMGLKEGIEDLCRWAREQKAEDRSAEAFNELLRKGLVA